MSFNFHLHKQTFIRSYHYQLVSHQNAHILTLIKMHVCLEMAKFRPSLIKLLIQSPSVVPLDHQKWTPAFDGIFPATSNRLEIIGDSKF